MEYCRAYGEDGFPEEIQSITEYREELKGKAKGTWFKEFVPSIIAQQVPGTDPEPAHSYLVYQEYLAWHAANGEGRPQPRRAVTDAVLEHHKPGQSRGGKTPDRNGARQDTPDRNGARQDTLFWEGWFLMPVDAR